MSMAAALCYGSRGGGAALAFHHQLDAYDTDSLIQALGVIRLVLDEARGHSPPRLSSRSALAFQLTRLITTIG
jgi:hypothetical protein